MNLPTLSIGLPNFNHARYVTEALRALLDQSVRPDEIIVLDDCSTDDSVDVISAFVRDHPGVRFVRNERNLGVVQSLNRLLTMASGDCFYGAAADDVLRPTFVGRSLAMLAAHPSAGLCSTFSYIIDARSRIIGLVPSRGPTIGPEYLDPQTCVQHLWRHGTWMAGNTVVYRRQALIEAGGFRVDLGAYTDGFAHELVAARHGACFVPEPLACWRNMAGGYSNALSADERRRIARHVQQLMATEFGELFRPGYAERWQRWWDYGTAVAECRGRIARRLPSLHRADEVPVDPGAGGSGALSLIARTLRDLEWLAIRLYAAVRAGYLPRRPRYRPQSEQAP